MQESIWTRHTIRFEAQFNCPVCGSNVRGYSPDSFEGDVEYSCTNFDIDTGEGCKWNNIDYEEE